MSDGKKNKAEIKLYEYFLYIVVTIFIFILAVPVVVVKLISYLVGSLGAPLKSVKNFIGFLLVLFIAAGGLLAFEIFVSYDIGPEVRSVMVEENDSFSSVVSDLIDADVLKGRILFKYMAVVTKPTKSCRRVGMIFQGKSRYIRS